jgi:recombination associated protein RdgC
MFKNALVYRITQWEVPAFADLEDRLGAQRFAECGASQPQSAGWVEPRGERHAALAESVAGQWILQLCTETKAVPASAVRAQLESEVRKVEDETGRKPRGRRLKELKEGIVHALLPRAFPKRAITPVWVDPQARLVVVGAASVKKADQAVTLLVDALGGGVVLRPLQTALSPAVAMSNWLASRESPAGFTVDRDCELKQPDSEKSTVRYARHTLDIDEIAGHIGQGKVPTQLALTWNDRVSFVLTEALTLKKLKLVDVPGQAKPEDKGFDADAAIVTGDLGPMIEALVDALGGEVEHPAAAAAATDVTRGPAANDDVLAA